MGKVLRLAEIVNEKEKMEIASEILFDLPQWFGIESSTREYILNCSKLPFIAIKLDKDNLGFISLKKLNDFSVEIYCMGVKKAYHHRGFGKKLILKAESLLKANGFKVFSVKTLGESHPDSYYANTRSFYRACGFYDLEEFTEIWGKENPCLIMVKML